MDKLQNIDEAHNNYTYIVSLRKNINTSFWQLVTELKRARDNRYWIVLGNDSWASYLAQPEIDLNEHTVDNYITAYNSIKQLNILPPAGAFDIDISKLTAIAPYLTKENAEELILKAKTLSRSDLRDEMRELATPTVLQELPEGQFNVIYADPPWQYANSGISGAAENHYPTMTTEDICNMNVPSAENSVLFLWATNPLLEDALRVCNAWSFNYKTNIAWIKERAGQGFYVKGQHELLFICVKGSFRPNDSLYVRSVVDAVREEHSRKPQKFYEIIETLYPNGKYLELFSRNKRERWVMWGNQ
jgi:N6-adenosine-specific RNA methylase IME4